jgi:hypothetical protein
MSALYPRNLVIDKPKKLNLLLYYNKKDNIHASGKVVIVEKHSSAE